ncbi:hypothetical protein M2459_002120 [Parabacteroides sp. PF5-5]|uniref:AsmA family protein n=1 Tax=unclassified Parabacteroides TaxID=2649774 RepID=UPI002477209B|nr:MULTISPECIES: AsmA-like C-terminal region-containing protein [unclassified Parabacteroides]MDH6306863.1 hypothetical protein [Parabacteroides sp. PH5-39]MDH6316309.1 hypothetical protein [Parabacteroides sp. PF5-13]MDH6319792.1 hypothetical protein [Parabacteroides sp. PH5-13]MDH6323617.1 hypothetical protein [Parabacteroides sp. PH5-8]MDH6327496.1 hypothetical protein [Parabacteroides sp. PH5-41]
MKNRKKAFIGAGIGLLFLFVVLPVIGFCILNWGILPPNRLTPLVEREVNKLLNAQLTCEKIELTFFETYPHLGVKIVNGSLVSFAFRDSIDQAKDSIYSQVDSLVHFAQATVTFRPMDYLFKKQITIGELSLENPHIHGYINENGKANWDIYSSEKDTVESAGNSFFSSFDLQKVRIEDGHFIYDDMQAKMYAEIEGFELFLKGSLIDEKNTFEIRTGSKAFLFESPSYSLKNELAFFLKSDIELKDNFQTVTFHDTEMAINNLPFSADGSITRFPETNRLGINIETSLKASDLNDLLQFVPEAYSASLKDVTATGSILLDGTIQGELGDSIIPTVDLRCLVENGSFRMKDVKQGIDKLETDINLHIDGEDLNASYVLIDKLEMKGLNSSIEAKGSVKDLMLSPAVNAYLKGNIDFTRIAQDIFHPDTLLLQGNILADIETSFRLDDITKGKYNNINALGKLDIDSFIAYSKPYDVNVFISNAHFTVDSTRSTSRFIAGDKLLNMALNIDSMNVKYKEDIDTNLSQLELTAKTSPEVDTAAVISVTSHIRVDNIRTRLPDSTWVVAKKAYLAGGIRPAESNKQTPNVIASITADSLRYFSIPMRTGGMLANSRFTVEALPYRDAMRQQRAKRQSANNQQSSQTTTPRDTTGWRARRDSLRATQSTQTASANETSQLLRNWEVRGKASFNQATLFSRLFPLRMRMEKTSVSFDTNNITFSDARFHAGKSSLTLNGELKNMRRAMLRGGKLTGNFSVTSDLINMNELLTAINKGMQYAEQHLSASEMHEINSGSAVDMDISSIQDSLNIADADSTDGIFIVPSFLDLTLTMDAKHIDYKDLEMKNVIGEVVLRNQSANLKKLDFDSNIGHGIVTMFYTSDKEKQEAAAGFDMEVQGILVEKLIDLYPAIDTLLPMLRSFEGIVDCQMSLTCDIDSTMSVVLPSLNTACFLHGKNMVLLDGETFTEISKTLMFKNKERNVIDSISVDLAINNNKIEIFPFLLEIDRYRVAVGGTHNLDMTFDYHISVLKSPVPFKLGIDVSGDLDKPKYKITKCKYKNTFDPAKEQDLIAEKTNIRENIRELIRKQIITNAPELAVVEAPPTLPPQVSETL